MAFFEVQVFLILMKSRYFVSRYLFFWCRILETLPKTRSRTHIPVVCPKRFVVLGLMFMSVLH